MLIHRNGGMVVVFLIVLAVELSLWKQRVADSEKLDLQDQLITQTEGW
jgi:hypothetical protein